MLFDTIKTLTIGLASPDQIRHWSSGEVHKPETINYRTQQPEEDGLFSQRIFGPTRDWSCACGKYQRKRTPSVICKKCGVELAPAEVRRSRMGHIELAASVAHPWYVRNHTIGLLLNLSPRQLLAVLNYQRYLVLSVNEERRRELSPREKMDDAEVTSFRLLATLKQGDLLEEEDYRSLSALLPSGALQAKTGAEAIRDLLDALNLATLVEDLRREMRAPGSDYKKVARRLHIVEAFRASGQRPGWMVLPVLPVLPPELRPLLILDGDRIASSDLNELYCRIVYRNNRLQDFLQRQAPEAILNHERRLLQEACTALFDNAHAKKRFTNSRHQPLRSLTDILQGKHGLFRRNLLGKRVDYSGRSVIVPGPDLLLHECGLPKEMACELFKPFLMRKLIDRQYARSPRRAKRMVERRDEMIWDLLDETLFERPVLLNRAPTLHRLSIQAFYPRLIEGKAIQLHPLVCSAFNADFDGDQMAVHVPLSEAAQEEARRLLLSTNNLRHPASGEPSLSPSQEIVLGCFYLTEDRRSKKARGTFADMDEVMLSYTAGYLDLHTSLLIRITTSPVYDTPPPCTPYIPKRGRLETTVGRRLFNAILPEQLGYRNYPMKKEALKALIQEHSSSALCFFCWLNSRHCLPSCAVDTAWTFHSSVSSSCSPSSASLQCCSIPHVSKAVMYACVLRPASCLHLFSAWSSQTISVDGS